MNTLIISTNRNRQPMAVLPMGACMVAQSAREAGHAVRMLDLMFEKDPTTALERELEQFVPDVVGFSVRNIDNNDMKDTVVYFRDLPPMVETVRKKSKATVKTVLGGAAVGVMPESLLRLTGTSCAIAGNGEEVFPKLLSAFAREEFPRDLPGLAWIENGLFKRNPLPGPPTDDNCPVPDFRAWLDLDAYLTRMATVPIQSKRGCPFECVYCTYALAEGRNHHLYRPESVVETIQKLVASGVRDIEFVDNVFNAPYDHALAICHGLAKIKPKPRLQTLELNPLFIDDALLTAMEQAGFVGVGITAESAAPEVLTGLRKGFTLDHVRRAADCLRRHSLPCAWIFMFGGPGETRATAQKTIDFAKNCIRPTDIAFFNLGIRVYPGTALERIAREDGSLTLPPRDMLEPVFYVSPQLDKDWLNHTFAGTMAEHLNFISSDSLGHPLVPKIYRLAYRLGVRQPVWKHTRIIRRILRFVGMDV